MGHFARISSQLWALFDRLAAPEAGPKCSSSCRARLSFGANSTPEGTRKEETNRVADKQKSNPIRGPIEQTGEQTNLTPRHECANPMAAVCPTFVASAQWAYHFFFRPLGSQIKWASNGRPKWAKIDLLWPQRLGCDWKSSARNVHSARSARKLHRTQSAAHCEPKVHAAQRRPQATQLRPSGAPAFWRSVRQTNNRAELEGKFRKWPHWLEQIIAYHQFAAH